MTPEKIARWHWRAEASGHQFDVRLIHLHVPADPDTFPYVEGHRLMLDWHDMFYPEELGNGSAETFITEALHRDIPVVRAHGVAGVTIWDQPITAGLSVHVALAAPELRFRDDMNTDRAFRVSSRHGDHQGFVTRLDAAKSSLSVIAARTWAEDVNSS